MLTTFLASSIQDINISKEQRPAKYKLAPVAGPRVQKPSGPKPRTTLQHAECYQQNLVKASSLINRR